MHGETVTKIDYMFRPFFIGPSSGLAWCCVFDYLLITNLILLNTHNGDEPPKKLSVLLFYVMIYTTNEAGKRTRRTNICIVKERNFLAQQFWN